MFFVKEATAIEGLILIGSHTPSNHTKEDRNANEDEGGAFDEYEKLKCVFYHPKYCITLGHRSCRSLNYGMNNKPKKERDEALKYIKMESSRKIESTVRKKNKFNNWKLFKKNQKRKKIVLN